jgi:hypothetical protein
MAGREGDFGHQQQRAAALREHGFDGVQIDFGLAGAGDAVQQERRGTAAWMPARICVEGRLLRGVQRMRRAHRRTRHRGGFGLERDHAPCAPASARRRSAPSPCFQVLQVVRAGMQFEERLQLALGLVQLALGRRRNKSMRKALGGRAQGSRSVCTCSAAMKPLRSSERDGLIGQRQQALPDRRPRADAFEHAQDAGDRIVGRGIEQQLARGVAAGIGERPELSRGESRDASGSMPRSTSPSGAQ